MKSIQVTIDPLGNPTVEAVGFNGIGCEAATKPIEDALAGRAGVDRVLKPEWVNTEEVTEQHATW